MEDATVSVHALEAGYFSLPDKFVITPLSDPNTRRTVPSLSFLIQHQSPPSASFPQGRIRRVVYDLGLRRDIKLYSPSIQQHAKTRQPITTSPCVVESLAKGGLKPDDIDYVILSHVHWDHIGMPSDFATSKFVVGNGASELLSGKRKLTNGSHSNFEPGLLPKARTIELLDPDVPSTPPLSDDDEGYRMRPTCTDDDDIAMNFQHWQSLSIFPSAMDIFNDGSVFIISAPGHLPGHITLLCRTSRSPDKYVLLGGDSCHDRRLLTGEKKIAHWEDPVLPGVVCCIHADSTSAEQTLERIKTVEQGRVRELGLVEVVFSHDAVWDADAKKTGRFFPGRL